MLIFPASRLAITANASWERSIWFEAHPGQRSTIVTSTLLPVQGCGTELVPPVHVTRYLFPHAAPLAYKPLLAARIILPRSSLPKHADAIRDNQKLNTRQLKRNENLVKRCWYLTYVWRSVESCLASNGMSNRCETCNHGDQDKSSSHWTHFCYVYFWKP